MRLIIGGAINIAMVLALCLALAIHLAGRMAEVFLLGEYLGLVLECIVLAK